MTLNGFISVFIEERYDFYCAFSMFILNMFDKKLTKYAKVDVKGIYVV